MALTVETGSGLANADSYLSVADADTYHMAHGDPSAWSDATETAKESALRISTRYLDAAYGRKWQGLRTSEGQALAWPRYGVEDYDGWVLDSDIVPEELQNATAILALKSLSDDLMPDLDQTGAVKSTSVKVGPISESTEYVGSSIESRRFRLVEAILGPLLITGSGAVGRIIRA